MTDTTKLRRRALYCRDDLHDRYMDNMQVSELLDLVDTVDALRVEAKSMREYAGSPVECPRCFHNGPYLMEECGPCKRIGYLLNRLTPAEAEVTRLRSALEKADDDLRHTREHAAACKDSARAWEREAGRLRSVIDWALGEAQSPDFPPRPEKVEGKPWPMFWWRTTLRELRDNALAQARGEK